MHGQSRMALTKLTFPSKVKVVTTKDYCIYTPQTAKEKLTALGCAADVDF